MLYNIYKNYIDRETKHGRLTDDMGEVMRILDLHNRYKKNIDKQYKDYTKLEWSTFKSIVEQNVPIKVYTPIYTDSNMYVIKYGKDDYHEYKKRYDNTTSWCTTSLATYQSYTDCDSYLYVIHYNNGALLQYTPNINSHIYDSKDNIIDADISSIILKQLENVLIEDKTYLILMCCDKKFYDKHREHEYIKPYIYALDQYYKIKPNLGFHTYIVEQILLDKIPCINIPCEDNIYNELKQNKCYILTRDNAHVYKRFINIRYTDFVMLYSMGLIDIDADEVSDDIIIKSYKDGLITLEQLPKTINIYNGCGITDMPVYVDYIYEHETYNPCKIIPAKYHKTLIRYFPNHPEYTNVKAGIYNKQETLIHFDNTVRYPIELIEHAEYISICPDLPEDYQRILLKYAKKMNVEYGYINKELDPINYVRLNANITFNLNNEHQFLTKHKLWNHVNLNIHIVTPDFINKLGIKKEIMESKHYHILLKKK